jgi:hypothetical protein
MFTNKKVCSKDFLFSPVFIFKWST